MCRNDLSLQYHYVSLYHNKVSVSNIMGSAKIKCVCVWRSELWTPITPLSMMENDIAEAIIGKCRTIQRLVHSYEENREPGKLDSLIYQVDHLYLYLVRWTLATVLWNLWVQSLSLIQEIYQSQSVAGGFTPSVPRSGSRGYSKLEITHL